jgi:hypothetical protein
MQHLCFAMLLVLILSAAAAFFLIICCSDRVQNLYFAYLFVLRAVMKAAPLLTSYDYNTGLPEEDAYTRQLITQLVSACAHAYGHATISQRTCFAAVLQAVVHAMLLRCSWPTQLSRSPAPCCLRSAGCTQPDELACFLAFAVALQLATTAISESCPMLFE